MQNRIKYPSFLRPTLRMAIAGLLLSGTLVSAPLSADSADMPGTRRRPMASQQEQPGEVFLLVQNPPQFPGGQPALDAFLKKNLRYPDKARRAHVEGTVFTTFVINTDGSLTDVQVKRGIGFGTDDEALRVVAAMPRWEPGRQSGKVVRVKYVLPISFKLD